MGLLPSLSSLSAPQPGVSIPVRPSIRPVHPRADRDWWQSCRERAVRLGLSSQEKAAGLEGAPWWRCKSSVWHASSFVGAIAARVGRLPSRSAPVPHPTGSTCFTAPFLAAGNGWGIPEEIALGNLPREKLQEPFLWRGTQGKKVMKTTMRHCRGGEMGGKNAFSLCKVPLSHPSPWRMGDKQTNPSWAESCEPVPGAAPEGVNSPASALSGQQPNKLCPRKTNHNHH